MSLDRLKAKIIKQVLEKGVFDVKRILKMDAKKGELHLLGDRVVIISHMDFANLHGAAEKMAGAGGASIIRNFGECLGKRDATMWRKHLPNIDAKTLVSFLPSANLVTGWGKVTEISLDPAVSECKIKFANCFEAEALLKAYGKRDHAQCYIMEGYLKALFNDITGKNCHIVETQCAAKGDELCEFQITLK